MNKITLFRHFLLLSLFAGGLMLGCGFMIPQKVSAMSMVLEGGRTEQARYCSCSAGCWKIYVGEPKSGWFMWCPLVTQTYDYYNIWPNAWQLGKAGTWMTCMQISYPYCRTDGGGYLLELTGTSMY